MPAAHETPRPRRRFLRWMLGGLVALIIAAAVGIVVWSQVGVYAAEPQPLADVRADTGIRFSDSGAAIIMEPTTTGDSTIGLVFIPGAKVDPWAYASTLSGLVRDEGISVVITRPWLNLAFFDLRPLASFTDDVPDVDIWMVGGHSLGGVRACMLAEDADALVLFASYCSTDLATTGMPVLSVSGGNDGLSTRSKIEDAAHLLPPDTLFVEIPGANHANFGAYGPQDGDGESSVPVDEMIANVSEIVGDFAAGLAGS